MKKGFITILLIIIVLELGFIAYSLGQPKTINEEVSVGGYLERGYYPGGSYKVETFLNATTTTSTSTNPSAIFVAGAKKITWYFSRGDTTGQGNSGSSTFGVEVSEDGTNWVWYNKLVDNVTNSNSQDITRVNVSSALAGTTTEMYSMDTANDAIKYIRCGVVEATDGEHTCKALISY